MWGLRLALDATYSADRNPTGVGVYSREILTGLAHLQPDVRWLWCYRSHRLLRSFRESLPENCSRRLFGERFTPRAGLFHGLNQRLPAKIRGRSVVTFHDLFVLTGDYSTPEFRDRFARQARDAAERTDLIITVSAFTADQVCALLGVERDRVRVIHHGVRFRFSASRSRERIVLSVGAVQRRKNTVRLVEAFERMPQGWKLILAGGTGYAGDEALQRIAESPRSKDIQVTGYVDTGTLHDLYQRAAIFAFPSLDEGFGMPVLDAMAYGIPVLTSNQSALPEVVGDAALQVNPLDVEEMAAGLTRLAHDASLCDTLAARGYEHVRRFSWESAVADTWRVYQELLR
jgi:glycosyltransferase involved in cell wall biosynthesis